ncbi:hypothetical protein COCNU_04G008980 [Cocos nucifera]|uniref:Uncharacterized protein n=1 Tax=Cocos nucifera TaxID=13894 RepID=A0A8K0I6I9_COCNU|nr:hypothetical protein COCNU_04G008980 [Cocos nucifera]
MLRMAFRKLKRNMVVNGVREAARTMSRRRRRRQHFSTKPGRSSLSSLSIDMVYAA